MEEKRRYKFAALPRRAVQPASSPRTVTDHQLKHVYNVFSVINKAWVSDEERGGRQGEWGQEWGSEILAGRAVICTPCPRPFIIGNRRAFTSRAGDARDLMHGSLPGRPRRWAEKA